MRVLVLGGTKFLGRHIVEVACARGHEVSVFNRGTAGPLAGVEQIHGDRDDGEAPEGSWDLVFDTARNASWVRDAVRTVDAGHWTFVSTISVYPDYSEVGITEESPVHEPGEDYGPQKVMAERELPAGSLIVRAGSIAGMWDDVGRLAHWVERIGAGGEVLAPDARDEPVQVVDARDLVEWMVAMAERGEGGVYNATGTGIPFGELIEAIPGDAEIVWADPEWLEEQGVEPWTDLPLWVGSDPGWAGFQRVDVSKAVAAGLTFRPLSETIGATQGQQGSGLSREREAELIRLYRERH